MTKFYLKPYFGIVFIVIRFPTKAPAVKTLFTNPV